MKLCASIMGILALAATVLGAPAPSPFPGPSPLPGPDPAPKPQWISPNVYAYTPYTYASSYYYGYPAVGYAYASPYVVY